VVYSWHLGSRSRKIVSLRQPELHRKILSQKQIIKVNSGREKRENEAAE
jgi:hypothetical protein